MNYPYKVGGGVMPAPRLSQFKSEETLAAKLTIQGVEMCFGGFYSVYYTIGDYTICVDGDENGMEKVWFDRTD